MINLRQIYGKVANQPTLLTESKKTHLKHLFEDGTLTFDDFRNIFKNVFTGKVGITSKVKKIPLSITYKDGAFALANDDNSIKEPFSIDKVCQKCKCNSQVKEALTTTMNDFMKVLNKLDQKDLNSIFANGQNYYSFDVVVPPEANLTDYGNRCFLQCNKVRCYDNTFKKITEDDDSTLKLSDKLGNCINGPELSQDKVKLLKGSTSPDIALKELLEQLEKIVDGIGYKATVNDYVKERYAKYIVNCALKKGIDLYRNSDFVNELIARLSYVADHRPNRADLVTYAKRDGVNWKAPEYKELIDWLESTADATNDAIIKPVEELVLKAGILIMKCLLGIVAVDPRHSVRKMLPELNATIAEMEKYNEGLTPEKIKIFRRCMKNLDNYQAGLPEDGILILYNGKVCKIKGIFGAINNIVKLMNY